MSTFFRVSMDGQQHPLQIDNIYSGYRRSACWIVGGSPALNDMPIQDIQDSLAPKIVINNAATVIRPDLWIAYDPATKFLNWVYNSPSVLKFQPLSRWNNVCPGTRSVKVCECPGMVFYAQTHAAQFHNFFDSSRPELANWSFSLIDAIQVAWRLGFRRMYLAGCSMTMDISQGGQRYAWQEECNETVAVKRNGKMEQIAQKLRQCRVNIANHGVQLNSVTPGSVFEDFYEDYDDDTFRVLSSEQALREIERATGDRKESAANLYEVHPNTRVKPTKQPLRDYPCKGTGPLVVHAEMTAVVDMDEKPKAGPKGPVPMIEMDDVEFGEPIEV